MFLFFNTLFPEYLLFVLHLLYLKVFCLKHLLFSLWFLLVKHIRGLLKFSFKIFLDSLVNSIIVFAEGWGIFFTNVLNFLISYLSEFVCSMLLLSKYSIHKIIINRNWHDRLNIQQFIIKIIRCTLINTLWPLIKVTLWPHKSYWWILLPLVLFIFLVLLN